MNKKRTGNSKFLKAYNEAGILDLIRTEKALSRADLSKLTGLSPTATGTIVSGLMEKDYIYENGIGQSNGGRKPVLLELKPGSYYSVGLDVDTCGISYMLVDITGSVIDQGAAKLTGYEQERVISAIENCVAELVEGNSIEASRLLGVGISVPAMVDAATHKVLLAPNLGWEDFDLSGELKKRLKLSVYVENEAMASAIYENWIGTCQQDHNFVCINIKSGIGAGIFTGGRAYRGSGGIAGEIGHIVVDENGPKCGCGNYGCLETFAATGRIVEKARKIVRQGVVSSLNNLPNADDISFEDVVRAARMGDEAARNLFNEAARYLGIALSNIVNTLDPSKIVLGKDFTEYGELVMGTLRGVVDRRSLKRINSQVEISISQLGDRSSAMGAAIIPLKVLFGR